MSDSILVTTAPVIQKIGANYFTEQGKPPFIGIDVNLRKNEEIVESDKTDLTSSPKKIASDVLRGETGWFKRGLVKNARRVTTESIVVEGQDSNELPAIAGQPSENRELPQGTGMTDSVDAALVAQAQRDEQDRAAGLVDDNGVDPLLASEQEKNES